VCGNLCDDGDDIAAVCESCVSFLPRLCDAIEEAVRFNGTSMSNTEHAGVSHNDIIAAVARVREKKLLLRTTGSVSLASG
jgi:hypothetical protein